MRLLSYLAMRIHNFEKLPTEISVCAQFAKLFTKFNKYLEAVKIQVYLEQTDLQEEQIRQHHTLA